MKYMFPGTMSPGLMRVFGEQILSTAALVRFGERGAACRPREKLDTKLFFQSDKPTADDGF